MDHDYSFITSRFPKAIANTLISCLGHKQLQHYSTDIQLITGLLQRILSNEQCDSSKKKETVLYLLTEMENIYSNVYHNKPSSESLKLLHKCYYFVFDDYYKGCCLPTNSIFSIHINYCLHFGGQGYEWFSDLCGFYKSYPSLHNIIKWFSISLKEQYEIAMTDPTLKHYFENGFDILSWLSVTDDAQTYVPFPEYLNSCPISLPCIFITQICSVVALLQSTKTTFQQFQRKTVLAYGHSQGVVPALVIASCDTLDDLLTLSTNAICYLFWLGLRSQNIWQTIRQKKMKLTKESRCMMSVSNIHENALLVLLEYINKAVDTKAHLHISIKNGPNTFIVSGDPDTIVFLKHKLQTSTSNKSFTKMLNIECPFHCSIIEDCLDQINNDAKRVKFNLERGRLKFDVLSTKNGLSMKQGSGCLVEQLICNQVVDIVDWYEVTKHVAMKASTYEPSQIAVLDFGPSGFEEFTGGISLLTAKNLLHENLHLTMFACNSMHVADSITKKYTIYDRCSLYNEETASTILLRNKKQRKESFFFNSIGFNPFMVCGSITNYLSPTQVATFLNGKIYCELDISFVQHDEHHKITSILNETMDTIAPNLLIPVFIDINQEGCMERIKLLGDLKENEGYPIGGIALGRVPSDNSKLSNIVRVFNNLENNTFHWISIRVYSLEEATYATGFFSQIQTHRNIICLLEVHNNVEAINIIKHMRSTALDQNGLLVCAYLPKEMQDYIHIDWATSLSNLCEAAILDDAVFICDDVDIPNQIKELKAKNKDHKGHSINIYETLYTYLPTDALSAFQEIMNILYTYPNKPNEKFDWFRIAELVNSSYNKPFFCIDDNYKPVENLRSMTYYQVHERLSQLCSQSNVTYMNLFSDIISKWLTRMQERFGFDIPDLQHSETSCTKVYKSKITTVPREDEIYLLKCCSRYINQLPFILTINHSKM